MTKEVRLIFLTALTLFIYAASIYLSNGHFVFPFPLNEIILLIVVIQYVYWHHKQRKIALTILGIGICSLLGKEFFYSLFLDQSGMMKVSSSLLTDTFLFLSAFFIVLFGVQTFLTQKNLLAKALSSFFIITFISSITFLPPNYTFYAYFFMLLSIIIQAVHKPFHLIWVLLFILESTKFLTIILNN